MYKITGGIYHMFLKLYVQKGGIQKNWKENNIDQ